MPQLKLLHTILKNWYRQPLGQELFYFESQHLKEALFHIPGTHWLQLGSWPLPKNFLPNHFIYQYNLVNQLESHLPNNFILGEFDKLPFENSSIDAVFVPHILEYHPNYIGILQECLRLIKPEGYLIILGFNPFSLWGLTKLFHQHHESLPWRGHFLSLEKIRTLLMNLETEIIISQYFFYRPPINDKNILQKTRWLEKAIQLLLPTTAGAYLIVAQKHMIDPSLAGPRWQWLSFATNKTLIEPATRHASYD